ILVWHYHDDDVAGPAAQVSLAIVGLGATVQRSRLQHYRVDGEHSNAYAAWLKMGSPQPPSAAQYAQLEAASALAAVDAPSRIDVAAGRAKVDLTLPRQAVSLIVVEW